MHTGFAHKQNVYTSARVSVYKDHWHVPQANSQECFAKRRAVAAIDCAPPRHLWRMEAEQICLQVPRWFNLHVAFSHIYRSGCPAQARPRVAQLLRQTLVQRPRKTDNAPHFMHSSPPAIQHLQQCSFGYNSPPQSAQQSAPGLLLAAPPAWDTAHLDPA